MSPVILAELAARVRQQVRRKASIDELAGRNADAELLVELTQALASSLDLREILHTVVARTPALIRRAFTMSYAANLCIVPSPLFKSSSVDV